MGNNSGEGTRAQSGGRFTESSSSGAPLREYVRGSESASRTPGPRYDEGHGVITHYPLSSVTTCFALGLAVGVIGGLLLFEPPAPRWYERVPDSFGRRWLESMLNSLPETVRAKVT